ncbi:hypothetical protein ASPSYDRAFT_397027 [Aspergillus sydowii CBS 593.65]|uniref:Uncharacterized protein n=1 Tax=Aspergillus sydowii CBS 593.65 TaxID=1036612 RepID=A0A1L9T977_9EURO|nr:uncharacterized protein ASPSYDRAFT_397027 [Aspergillus sydowii CBS 593.65]OJJ55998.1 hypothetical protein ASPSYDRAFT_397027 [Aspergillus sydowii CBS 593.65]
MPKPFQLPGFVLGGSWACVLVAFLQEIVLTFWRTPRGLCRTGIVPNTTSRRLGAFFHHPWPWRTFSLFNRCSPARRLCDYYPLTSRDYSTTHLRTPTDRSVAEYLFLQQHSSLYGPAHTIIQTLR